ncbi:MULTISPECIES: hypothetical protein [unclassified Streptomyces]|nr:MULTISPECIES: hypothetical protein [unclassified Streptomyces]
MRPRLSGPGTTPEQFETDPGRTALVSHVNQYVGSAAPGSHAA